MASQKSIKLYVYENETSQTPFCYSNGEQVEVSAFKYTASRMGGVPTITCSIKSMESLDSRWSNAIYCLFRGEKFYLRQTPNGTKSNSEYGYSYSLEFVSERELLDNVYVFDAVASGEVSDKPLTNSTKVSFFGDIEKFADKLNASLRYSGIQKKDSKGNISGYQVIVDKGITSEEKFVSIEDAFFSNAIQEIYNTFEIPYYFKGKEIHIGYKDALIPTVFKYGVDESLLSIKRENSNNKIVNRETATGSSENIPYYYPNKSPKGDIIAEASNSLDVKIVNYERFANAVDIDESLTYTVGKATIPLTGISDDGSLYVTYNGEQFNINCKSGQKVKKWFKSKIVVEKSAKYKVTGTLTFDGTNVENFANYIDFISLYDEELEEMPRAFDKEQGYFDIGKKDAGTYWVFFGFQFEYRGTQQYKVSFTPSLEIESAWKNSKGKSITLSDAGLEIVGDTAPQDGYTIKQTLVSKVNNMTNLMPSIYRETKGEERFYNAVNGKYVDAEGNPIVFNNPYIEGRPSENIASIEEIKPTIKETTNAEGRRIDMFSEIAYDEGDSDEVYTDNEGNTSYKHPHFFAKLRKLPFNLFDCAIEGSEMTFSITSGDCGACNFKIKVDGEFPYKNTVQVYEEDTTDDDGVLHKKGSLVRDENGMVLCGIEGFQPKVTPQDIQQDTINNEVWIALEKEEDTYGILMPKAPKYKEDGTLEEAGYRIKACSSDTLDDGDTFVITNIHLPEEYIIAAEKKLEDAIIANMKDNNDEKFNFSITFSSIYLEEHKKDVLDVLDENSQITIEYAGEQVEQYVSSYSYNMNSGSALPTISVSLSESLSVSQNSLKTAISQVQLNVKKALEQNNKAQQEMYLSKSENDVVNASIDFRKGATFGDGAKIEIDDNNNTKLIIDYLTVNKKAVFKALDIQDMHHIGGQTLITPASMVCSKVEEMADFYRCYFQNYDDGGNQIFNNFVVNDQAICKTLNSWGTTYYWRLVVGIGNDYIDLSKNICDANSDVPKSGDKIIQLGNRSTDDNSRKSAIAISSYGELAPSFIMYTGIDSFSLEGKAIHGTVYRNNHGEYEAYFFNYGSMLLGDPNKEKDYIEFDASKGTFEVKANVKFKASQSLDDIDAFKNLSSNVSSNSVAITQINTTLGTINTSIESLDYLKKAILDGQTQVVGGLILSSLIQLGFTEGEAFKIMSGINGVYDAKKAGGGIASWYGGAMQDKENLAEGDSEENSAKSLFRFDGSGYLADGNITWDNEGYGSLGGGFLTWGKNPDGSKFLKIADNVKLGTEDSIATVLDFITKFDSMFGVDEAGDIYVKSGKGFYTSGFITAGKKGTSGGGGTGGGGYTQWAFSDILNMTETEGTTLGNLAAAYAVKEAYEQTKSTSITEEEIKALFS